jgi:Icc-related predicted phosphoesterase
VQCQRHWLDTEFREWLEALDARGINVVATWGNHDFVGEHSLSVPKDLPWTLLVDQEVEIAGLRIYGTPWVPNLRSWAFYGSHSFLTARAEAIPEGLDVLLTHGPPYGFRDDVGNNYGARADTHVGDRPMRDRFEVMAAVPQNIVCGHIHEGYGIEAFGNAMIYNTAHVDEFYVPKHPPTTIWRLSE